MNNPDSFLLSAVAAGDRKAFEIMFKKYYPKVRLMLYGMIKDEFSAENIAQDLFMNIWLNKEKLSEINSFDSYLYISTRNAAINQLKNYREIETYKEKEPYDVSDNSAEQEILMNELEKIIQDEINKMPDQRRKVFIMSRIDGKTTAQIAKELNISPKTAEKHLSLALRTLRKIEYFLLLLLINVN